MVSERVKKNNKSFRSLFPRITQHLKNNVLQLREIYEKNVPYCRSFEISFSRSQLSFGASEPTFAYCIINKNQLKGHKKKFKLKKKSEEN